MHCTYIMKSHAHQAVSWPNNQFLHFSQSPDWKAAYISGAEYILPFLRYASPHPTCASKGLGIPQRVKQLGWHRLSIAQSIFHLFSRSHLSCNDGRINQSAKQTHQYCVISLFQIKSHFQQDSASYARPCFQNLFIICHPCMNTCVIHVPVHTKFT